MRRSLFRHMLLGACLSAPFLLVGCSSDEGVPQSFPPLRYTYLAPISLNVASINTEVPYAPVQDGSSLDAMSPEAPIQAVEQMLQDRLVAGGGGGRATVTINTASINRVNDTAVGNVSVKVSVTSADGRRAAYTQATVTRTRTMPDDTSDDALRAFLYAMTSDLVNAENVELEYQIRQHLTGWLVGGSSSVVGGPAAPTPVEAEPLSGPGIPAVGVPTSLGAPAPLGAAPAAMPVPMQGVPVPASMPSAAPAMPSVPGMQMTAPPTLPQGDDAIPTMPSGDLGLPQGNPVQLTPPALSVPAALPGTPPSPANQLVPVQPPVVSAPAVSAPAVPAPAITAPAVPAAPANPSTLPPLPATITP